MRISPIKKQRNEFGRQIRKDYEAHRVQVRRKDIKELVPMTVVVKETKYLDMKTKGKLEILEELPDGWLLCRQDGHVFKRRYRIRKLTPRTCFRLQGLKDSDVDLIQAAGISESQQYKLAGNSICVPVLEAIFTQLFTAESDTLF